ncbi:hypothetical protein MVES_000973 [Malassezia vespertilionis]|uniref:Uncharacterized protein n=1 Tax=Malassezia vespertilionis TaxID=2020962 RepID=A0A2N1JF49_9BASI|nr:hypothetical protein MVES_000973 [Malassezia vespertilionis]
MSGGTVPSEDILNRKLDLCVSNALVKSGIGFTAVRIVPSNSVVHTEQPSAFDQLQKRVGSMFGATADAAADNASKAASSVSDTAKDATDKASSIGENAHHRFAELSSSAGEAVEKQWNNLQDAAQGLSQTVAEKSKELTDSVQGATNDKVRAL